MAFADGLASRGYDLQLFARRRDVLASAAEGLRQRHHVEVNSHAVDLADAALATTLEAILDAAPPSVGIYNAAYGPVGDYLDTPLENLLQTIRVSVRGPLIWTRILGEHMRQRRHGSLVLMSSLAGEQGLPKVAAYAASKSFNTRLAEGLWAELADAGVNVLVCCAGAIRTPSYENVATEHHLGTMDPAQIVDAVLSNLANGPRVIPGWQNRLWGMLLGRLLPRGIAVRFMGRATARLKATTFD